MSADDGRLPVEVTMPAEVMQAAKDHARAEVRLLQDRIRLQRKELKALGRANQRIWDSYRLAIINYDRAMKDWRESTKTVGLLSGEIQKLTGQDMSQVWHWIRRLK